ncbi:hypothetical protein GGR57DRAFT_490284 [Xylariaceae sp. FL1272]|nr:hypothetical protein GGR57DRAFT_490284 [Xylariaceae sp. FL1272]
MTTFNEIADELVELGQFANPNEIPHETPCLSSLDDIKYEKSLELIYEEDGYFSCMKFSSNGRSSLFGNPPPTSEISRTHSIQLKPGQWIEGFEMTLGDPIESRIGGPVGIVNVDVWICGAVVERGMYHPEGQLKRLFVPADGNTLVGVRGTSKGNRINTFALIQSEGDQGLPRRATNDEFTRNLLWRDGLPPPHIRVLPDSIKWLQSHQRNNLQMEALLFGTDEGHGDPKTIADRLIRISASGDASRIELTFAGDAEEQATTTRAVGDPDDGNSITKSLKSMQIDGPGGDAITSVFLPPMPEGGMFDSWFTPLWFGIVTKHGKQAIFGEASTIKKARLVEPPPGHAIVGLFLSPAFMQYSTMGVLIAPIASPPSTPQIVRDELGRIWDQTPASSGWKLCGPCIGCEDKDFRVNGKADEDDEFKDVSGESAICLDLSQPVVCFRGLYAAPYWCHLSQLGGFEIQFANGSSCFVGMPLDSNKIPMHEEVSYEDARAGLTTVPAEGPRIAGSKVHTGTPSQVLQQNDGPGRSWHPDGERGVPISAVHVWGGGYLHGIQFEMENGKCSPKWGKAGSEPSISFRASIATEGRSKSVAGVVGLKFVVRQPNGWGGDAPSPVMVQAYTRN